MSRDDIAGLVHRYADAVVHFDGEQWGSCWADDAHWVLGPGRDVTGRPAIVELWNLAMSSFRAVIQNVLNGDVELDGDTGSGRWYIMEHCVRGNDSRTILLAHYDDTYVRRDGRWYFASRQLHIQYQGPPDLSGPFLNDWSARPA